MEIETNAHRPYLMNLRYAMQTPKMKYYTIFPKMAR